jgi:hypothetical protein
MEVEGLKLDDTELDIERLAELDTDELMEREAELLIEDDRLKLEELELEIEREGELDTAVGWILLAASWADSPTVCALLLRAS